MRNWGGSGHFPPQSLKIWEIELYFEFEAHILQDFYMDDFQSFDGYFPSKTDFTPPYPPISGHSVIAPSKFSLNTVSLCIDRRYWSFGTVYHDWWVLYVVKWWVGVLTRFPHAYGHFWTLSDDLPNGIHSKTRNGSKAYLHVVELGL